MRVVIQRVSSACVAIGGVVKSSIGQGLLVLVGIGPDDTEDDVEHLVKKTAGLRIFDDADGVMNRSVVKVGGGILIISQFTLMASTRKGNRPSYIGAARHDIAIPLYKLFCERMSEALGHEVSTGEFGADMQVTLVNDGPVTICIDSRNR